MSKRYSSLLVFIGVGYAALISGCGKEAAHEKTPAAPVVVEMLQSETFGEWTDLVGATQPLPNQSALITSAVDGRVIAILPDDDNGKLAEGSLIDDDDVVVQLDDRVARGNRDKAAAAVTDLVEQEKQADIAVSLARIEVNRLEELSKGTGAATALPFPLVSRVEKARAELALKDAESRKEAAAAKSKAASAELRALDAQLDLYAIKPQISGRLGLIRVVRGQNLAAGTVVAEVVNLDDIDVVCYVAARAAGQIEVGQQARLASSVDDEGKPVFAKGTVVFVAAQAQPDTGNFAVKLRFPNKQAGLRANSVVHAGVLTKPEAERLAIPESALMEDQQPPTVILVEETEEHGETKYTARKAAVEVGARGTDEHGERLVEIKKLVNVKTDLHNARIVVEGGYGLRDGDEVAIKEKEEEK